LLWFERPRPGLASAPTTRRNEIGGLTLDASMDDLRQRRW